MKDTTIYNYLSYGGKMYRHIIAAFIVVIIISGALFGNAPVNPSTKCPMVNHNALSPGNPLPAPEGLGPAYYPPPVDEPLGEVFMLGTTWYDIQHNSTCGRQAHVDSEGWIHVVWMNGIDNGATQRHIFYQIIDPAGNILFPGGTQVDQMPRAGYTDLAMYPDNRAMPCYHQGQGGATNFHTALAFDYIPRSGAFAAVEPPWFYSGGVDLEVIWPKVAQSRDNAYHILSHENPPDGTGSAIQHEFYIRGEFSPTTYTITYPDSQTQLGVSMMISQTVAASPVSDRVALAYLEVWATDPLDTTQHDNDLILIVSPDGINWDWSDTINVTNWIPPDPGLLPDTLLANKDTLRVYAEVCLFFDYSDVLHAVFTTEGYYHYEGTITWGNGFIWHWDEVNQVFSMVANGWFDNGFYDPGVFNTYTTRPQAAIDSTTGDIYCMYQRYFQPLGPSVQYPYPYQAGDTSEFSASGWPNGEIWMTKSTDNGYSWAEGINVSRTPSPNALPGDCMSELTPSMAPDVSNGCCHIFYILDRDAGCVIQTEGSWTLNDAIYQRVPIDSIPDSPRLAPYPMHIDSTGMPGPGSVENPDDRGLPLEYALHPPYPNPFNPETNLIFNLKKPGKIRLAVYDISGREIALLFDRHYDAGRHQVEWDASMMPSGIYFARLQSEGFQETRKLLLIK